MSRESLMALARQFTARAQESFERGQDVVALIYLAAGAKAAELAVEST